MVEIIPKQSSQSSLSGTAFLYAAVVLFFAAVGSFFVLQKLQGNAQDELQRLEIELGTAKTPEERVLEGKIFSYERKIKDFASLAASRESSLPPFLFLEENTHPKVLFTKLEFNPGDRVMQLQGETQDFSTLDAQILILKQKEEVGSLDVSSLLLGDQGQVKFTLKIVFSQSLFK
ncbi:MAG: hypothetical protein HYS60_00240 [Candidatus Wildermuthbacteria bacterium]|nr:hypothetical protein [Candidatus Wildermuthbacteria bacterium]